MPWGGQQLDVKALGFLRERVEVTLQSPGVPRRPSGKPTTLLYSMLTSCIKKLGSAYRARKKPVDPLRNGSCGSGEPWNDGSAWRKRTTSTVDRTAGYCRLLGDGANPCKSDSMLSPMPYNRRVHLLAESHDRICFEEKSQKDSA